MDIITCKFCRRPFNGDYNHEEECESNPANWESLENGRQLMWAVFWVLLAIALVSIFMFVAAERTASVFSFDECIVKTEAEQGFAGDHAEARILFASKCNS